MIHSTQALLTRGRLQRWALVSVALNLLLGAPAAHSQVTVRKPGGTGPAFAWVGAAQNHAANPVNINGVNVGRLDFSHRLYKDGAGANPDVGGLALAGGFTGTGANPFPDWPVDPDNRFRFVQTIRSSHPLHGAANRDYVDATDPRDNPVYPFRTAENNPAGNAFTHSFYDGPTRPEGNAAVNWEAELMLVCLNDTRHNIGIVGSFNWGYDIAANATPGDGRIAVTRRALSAFGDASRGAVDAVKEETKGTKTQRGWTIGTPGLCTGFGPPAPRERGKDARSENTGASRVLVESLAASRPIDQVLIFPRNHALLNYGGVSSAGPQWVVAAWPQGHRAPDGQTMFQAGLLFSGPPFYGTNAAFDFALAQDTGTGQYGHESFFDVFVRLTDGTWGQFAYPTQELLGDLNDDGQVTFDDLALWDIMFGAPAAYEAATGFSCLWRGDFDHDGVLTLADRQLFEADLGNVWPLEASPESASDTPSLGGVQFQQLDWLRTDGTIAVSNSVWGRLTLSYQPAPVITYLNVVLANQADAPGGWAIRNAPLFGVDNGDFAARTEAFDLDLTELSVSNGMNWPATYYQVFISTGLLAQVALVATHPITVGDQSVAATDSPDEPLDLGPFLAIAPPKPIQLGGAPMKLAPRRDIRPVQEAPAHCAAGSFARSVDWLNRTHNFGIPRNAQQIYDDLVAAGVSRRRADGKPARTDWIRAKDAYARQMSHDRIRTRVWDPGDLGAAGFPDGMVGPIDGVEEQNQDLIDWLKTRFERGEDVELAYIYKGGAHIITLVDAYMADGKFFVDYRDDEDQGDDDSGDRAIKRGKEVYQDANGKWHFASDANSIYFAVGEGAPQPGPMDEAFDWLNNRRRLTYFIEPGTPAHLAGAARFAAENLNHSGTGWTLQEVAAPAAWSLLAKADAIQPDIRVRAAFIGDINLSLAQGERGPNFPDAPDYPTLPYDYPDSISPSQPHDDKPTPDNVPAGGGTRRFARAPLAYFQPGPYRAGRQVKAGEVVFNLGGDTNSLVPWDTAIGSAAFDPRRTALHEWGHAVRLEHDNRHFDDDEQVHPPYSRPGANVVTIRRGADNQLQTPRGSGDALDAAGDITAGPDAVADSGKKETIMASIEIRGAHGANPDQGFPLGSAYRYTVEEQASAKAAAAHRARGLNPPDGLSGANGNRELKNVVLKLYDDQGNLLNPPNGTSFNAGLGPRGDWVEQVRLVQPVRFEAELDVKINGAQITHVRLFADSGLNDPTAARALFLLVPGSPHFGNLDVRANFAANTLTISDPTNPQNPPLVVTALDTFHPADHSRPGNVFFNAGFLGLVVTGARPVVDTDGDGMPDAWEQAYGFDPRNPADGLADADQDGLSNANEYRAGTNPRDALSLLRLDARAINGLMVLSFQAVSGRAYTVQHTETVTAPSWRSLAEIPAGPARVELVNDPIRPGARFYRLLLAP